MKIKHTMKRLGATLSVFVLAGSAKAVTTSTTRWKGESSSDWLSNANWLSGVPGEDMVAIFTTDFAAGNNQPVMGSTETIDELRVINPEKDLVITVNGTLNIDRHSTDTYSIRMNAAKDDLAIVGSGSFIQRNFGGDATWLINSANAAGGDLTIDTEIFEIQSQALTINVGSIRTVDIKSAASTTTASVFKKTGGRLILGGQNGWTGSTTIDEGTLQLATNNAISSASALTFNNNSTLETGGFDGDFSTLKINNTVTLDFQSLGTSELSFADSSSVVWTTPNLIITNFTKGSDSIRFGTDASGLTAAQLAGITLNGSTNLTLNSSGYLAGGPDFQTGSEHNWKGDANSNWFTAANWASNNVPDSGEIAVFHTVFSSNNFQPSVAADVIIDELRVAEPGQDVVITIDSGKILNMGHNTASPHHSIQMGAAHRNLTIAGAGQFMQQPGFAADPKWDITSANGGDLTIDTALFGISNNVTLAIDVGPLRSVDIKTGCGISTASVTKLGEGLLILGGQNGWSGDTTITAGTLQLAENNALSTSSALVFNDGTTLGTGGYDGDFSTLEIRGAVTFDFQSLETSALSFADLSSVVWTTPNLVITNFTKGSDSIRFGSDDSGLTAVQLAATTLNGSGNLSLDSDGYLTNIVAATIEPHAEYFVDASVGDDASPGTEAAPFRTIEAARDTVRGINAAMTGDIVVYLRGGSYPISQTIEMDERDSGANGFNVVYRNYPNEAPILEGGVPITGWTPLSNGIWQADVGDFEFIQLYVNNKLAQRARYPEAGQENQIENNNNTTDNIQIEHAYVAGIPSLPDLNRVQLVLARSFTLSRVRIASISTSGTYANVTPLEPDRTNHFDVQDKPSNVIDGKPSFYFENHLNFLDTPGEWFLDVDTDIVYYMPLPGEDLSVMEVIAPKTERLLSMQNAQNVTFFGLTFQHSSWNTPQTEGMVQRQAAMHITPADKDTVNPAALYFNRIHDVRIERCIFRQMGANGINFDTGTQSNMVVGNVFSEIADTAIGYDIDEVRSITQNPVNLSKYDTFDSNYFFHMGTIYYGGGAMFAFWPDTINITHNEVSYTGGLGINVGWGAEPNATALKTPNISYNRIHDAAVWCRDSGGIHTKSDSSGGIIYRNWIYNVNTVDWWKTGPDRTINGVHLDDNTENYTIEDNVFMNCESYDIRTKEGVYVTMINNGGQSQSTKDNSGIRAGYRDIKNFHQGGAIGRDLEPGEPYTGAASAPLAGIFEDLFDGETVGAAPAGYTVAAASGCSAAIADIPGGGSHSLRMNDGNVGGSSGVAISKSFAPQSERVSCEFKIKPGQTANNFYFSFQDAEGRDACRLGFTGTGLLRYYYRSDNYEELGNYAADTWYTIRIEANVVKQQYSLWINGQLAMGDALFMNDQRTSNLAERVGPINTIDMYNNNNTGYFDIDYVRVEGDLPVGATTTRGTPRAWFDGHHDTTGWTAADFELFDLADVDGDGVQGWKEWNAGTDPNDGASLFQISDAVMEAGSGLSLSWSSVAGRYYTVQSAESPAGPWSDVADAAYVNKPGTGAVIHYFKGTLPEAHGFFRIAVSPTP